MGNKSMDNNVKNNICKFLIVLFIIMIFISLIVFSNTSRAYISEKANVAQKKINALQTNIWNLNPNVDTSKLDKIELKRIICIGTIVISVIGIIINCIVLFSKGKKTINPKNVMTNNDSNNSTQSKLKELELMYKNNLITKEEYDSKRKEILDRF